MDIVIINQDLEAVKLVQECLDSRNDIYSVKTFKEAEKALEHIISHRVDVVFLDTGLAGLSRVEWVKRLPAHVCLIMTSAQNEYAAEAYDLGVLDYMVKPLSVARCHEALSKCSVRKHKTLEVFFIKVNNQLIKIRYEEIYFIEADGDYVAINTAKSKFVVNIGIRAMEDILREKPFARIHRSFIVAIDKIDRIVDNKILIKSLKLPIGNAYKKEFIGRLQVV